MTAITNEPQRPDRLRNAGAEPHQRLASLDAYRGLVMLAMASAGLGVPAVAGHFSSGFWVDIAPQFGHAAWEGCRVWDLIQPAFMFMVGVAIPYSYGARQARGDSYAKLLRHAVVRALILIALSVFLVSAWSERTEFIFTNVLAQIGLGYVVAFLLWQRPAWVQLAVVATILVGYWLAFYAYGPVPAPGTNLDRSPMEGTAWTGLWAHWNKNANFAAWVDVWFLNLLPRDTPYTLAGNEGGYQTLNFVPSIATMVLGVMAGEWIRSARRPWSKAAVLAAAGALLLAAGLIAGWTLCPVVKRIWTPSWVLWSGGIVVWGLTLFYLLLDVCGLRRLAFPLAIVGMNSIAVYVMAHLLRGWTWDMIVIHFGPLVRWWPAQRALRAICGPGGFNPVYLPIVESVSVVLAFWLACLWMYRQKIFVRI